MKTEIPLEQLLRWRLKRLEDQAPAAPRASRLLETVRPWWETWPEQFPQLLHRLMGIQIAFGHAMSEAPGARRGFPVPALVVRGREEMETSVRMLYLDVRENRLRLRFHWECPSEALPNLFEATFISEQTSRPLFSAPALRSVDGEFRVDAELPENLAAEWASLKVVDRMPFRLILRTNVEQV